MRDVNFNEDNVLCSEQKKDAELTILEPYHCSILGLRNKLKRLTEYGYNIESRCLSFRTALIDKP